MPNRIGYIGASAERLSQPRIPAIAYMEAFGEELGGPAYQKLKALGHPIPHWRSPEAIAESFANLSIAGSPREVREVIGRSGAIGYSLTGVRGEATA